MTRRATKERAVALLQKLRRKSERHRGLVGIWVLESRDLYASRAANLQLGREGYYRSTRRRAQRLAAIDRAIATLEASDA